MGGDLGDRQAIPAPRTERDRRALGSLQGLAVGDALGAPWEGSELDPARAEGPLQPSGRVARWTDDTQMALSVVGVLESGGTIEQDALASGFARRYQPWRGYSSATRAVLAALRDGEPWRALRERIFRGGSFGNGSAMRAAPIGAYFHDAPAEEVIEQADLSAAVTHSHPEGRAGAVAVALAAWLAARSRGTGPDAGSDLLAMVADRLPPGLDVTAGLREAARLAADAPLDAAVAALGNGSRVSCQDTVPMALWLALHRLDDYESGVRHAVAAGGDTDTMAAIVGGIIAARVGCAGIPEPWLSATEPVPLAEP